MRVVFRRIFAILVVSWALGSAGCSGCSEDAEGAGGGTVEPVGAEPIVAEPASEAENTEAVQRAREDMLDRDYPLHGLVTGLQLPVRKSADPEAPPVGWLRIGARVRLKREPTTTATCNTGWHQIYPEGWACAGQGIEIAEAPPNPTTAVPPPRRDHPLPYDYWYIKDPIVPEYHRLPSRDEQRGAVAIVERYNELFARSESRAAQLLAGELPNEPQKPAVVHRFLNRGFFVAGTGIEVRAFRHFVRTVRGRYVKQSQLIARTGSELSGIELGEERTLPVAWAVRTAKPMLKRDRDDGTIRWVDDEEMEPWERHTVLEGWTRRQNIGGSIMHVLETDGGERYLRSWFAAVAERIERPSEVAEDEPWVHVDLGEQTLVLYRGDTPTYATLVSTGQEGFETPTGVFQIRRKYIADTMSNLGAGLDDQYSIEDVPWTQYFEGSFALHGAFWHDRFGLVKSHGCVNLAPQDALRVFNTLWPRVPDGWLGVTTEQTSFRGSHVVVTE